MPRWVLHFALFVLRFKINIGLQNQNLNSCQYFVFTLCAVLVLFIEHSPVMKKRERERGREKALVYVGNIFAYPMHPYKYQ